MGNPRASAAEGLNSRINSTYNDLGRYSVTPMSLAEMNAISRNQIIGDRNRALSQVGGLNTARGLALGLSNPYKYAQRGEADVYNQYSGALQGLLGSNIDRSFNQSMQARQAAFARLAQLLGLQQGNIGNLSSGMWNEQIAPLLGSAIGAAGTIYGGGMGRSPQSLNKPQSTSLSYGGYGGSNGPIGE